METFGEYIRQLRSQKALTLTQLAAKLGVDSANLSKIENGKRDLDEKKLPKLARVFGLELPQLKEEYYSDKIARKLYEVQCTEKTLLLAEKKIRYIRQKKSTQGKLDL